MLTPSGLFGQSGSSARRAAASYSMKNSTRNILLLAASALAFRAVLQARRTADLGGQVVLITGGSRGLGLALAHEFGRHGCRLALCARDGEALSRAQAELEAQGYEVYTAVRDLTETSEVERLITKVTAHYGQIDILVNNAGIIEVGPVQNMTRSYIMR